MAKVNNLVLALTIVLLFISLVGTFTLLGNINFETPGVPGGVQQGQVKVSILPEPGSDAATGFVGFKVLPEG
jgi:hypothetical protein